MSDELLIFPDGLMALLTLRAADGTEWTVGAQLSEYAVGKPGNRRPTSLVLTPTTHVLAVTVVERDDPCCELHDKDPELMPRCGPDDRGGYCCDRCPTPTGGDRR